MPSRDARVDAHIRRAAPFAQPILRHLRRIVHKACPGVIEGMKWNSPHFDYKGIFCSMAAFKEYSMLGFWKHGLLMQRLPSAQAAALGTLGRITSIEDLPGESTLVSIIRAGAALNDAGVKVVRPVKPRKPPVREPADFLAALKANKKAWAGYSAFSPSHRREYVEWITEAKTEATRLRRLTQGVEWIAEGKSRNWKYQPR